MAEIHLGDVGTKIVIQLLDQDLNPVDLSSCIEKKIRLLPPNNSSIKEFELSILTDGLDGYVYYIIEDGVIDTIGTWEVQVLIVLSSGNFHSSIFKMKVDRNIGG